MKEKNAFESSPGGASASEQNNEESMEIDDDEDFDLETPNRTQSLGMNVYILCIHGNFLTTVLSIYIYIYIFKTSYSLL